MLYSELPKTLECEFCKNIMEVSRIGIWHVYYRCVNQKCKNVMGRPYTDNLKGNSNNVEK